MICLFGLDVVTVTVGLGSEQRCKIAAVWIALEHWQFVITHGFRGERANRCSLAAL